MKSDLIPRLNPKTQTIAATVGGFGGLGSEEIAHAMAGLKRGSYALGYAIHGHEQARQELTEYLIESLEWKIRHKTKEYARIISLIAVHEAVGDSPCHTCGGKGYIYKTIEHPDEAKLLDDSGLLTIPCNASQCIDGNYRMSSQEKGQLIAEAIGENYTKSLWDRGYAWDMAAAQSQLYDWKNKLEAHLSKRLDDQ